MKTIMIDPGRSDHKADASWFFLADSSVINSGKPFFIPENSDSTEVCLSPAVKIIRLGKTIANKFASRYYNAIAPCLHFRISDLYENLIRKGLSTDPAVSFDRSFMTGDFIPIPSSEPIYFSLWLNNELRTEYIFEASETDEAITMISRHNTLKTGDLLIAKSSPYFKIKSGDFLEIKNHKDRLFHCKIK